MATTPIPGNTLTSVPASPNYSPAQLLQMAKDGANASEQASMARYNSEAAARFQSAYAAWKFAMDNHPDMAGQIGPMPKPPLKGFASVGPDGWPVEQFGPDTVVPTPVYTAPAPNPPAMAGLTQENDERPAPPNDHMPEGWSFVDPSGVTWFRRYQPTPFGVANLYMTQGLYAIATGQKAPNGGN